MVRPKKEKVVSVRGKDGETQTEILAYIYGRNEEFDKYDVHIYICDWSINVLKRPITKSSGTYKHLKKLGDTGFIEYDDIRSKVKPIEDSHLQFKVLCKFAVKYNTLNLFIKSEYFKASFEKYFIEIVKESFNVELPRLDYIDGNSYIEKLVKLITQSVTAVKFMILQPMKLQLIQHLIKYDEPIHVADSDLSLSSFNEIMNLLGNENDDKVDIKRLKQDEVPWFKFVHKLTPLLATCFYIDVFNAFSNSDKDKEQLKEAMESSKEFGKITGYQMQVVYDEKLIPKDPNVLELKKSLGLN